MTRISSVLVLLVVAAVSFVWGAAAIHYQFFPFYEIRQLFQLAGQSRTNLSKSFRAQSFETFYRDVDVVFAGDSITANFEWQDAFSEVAVANRGIGSDTTAGLLNRLDGVLLAKPEKVFLMIGINDLNYLGRTAEGTFRDYEEIVSRLRAAGIVVYIQSTLPCSGARCASAEIRELNRLLKKYADETGIAFIDLHRLMAEEDHSIKAKYTADGVHLTPAGYALWREQIASLVARRCASH